jgi:hypothetical protein
VYDFIRFVPRGVAVPPRRRSAAAAVSGILLLVSAPLAAQMPGVPVLQNAFTAPGLVAAVNGGWVDDAKATALAGSWTPGSARFVLSAGAGVLFPDEGDDVFAWGARLAVPIPRPFTGNFGVGVFVGFGGAEPDVGAVTQLPAGIALGWRRAIGATRALSRSAEHVRVSAGLDFAVTPSWGVTVGVETGQEADVDEPGPTGMAVGLGLSYAFGRGR